MRLRFLRDLSILARLGILTMFIAVVMIGNLWIARNNFTKLASALSAEGASSAFIIESAAVERQLYQSWIALSSAEMARAGGPTSVAGMIAEFNQSLDGCKGSIEGLAALKDLPVDLISSIASIKSFFGLYETEASKEAEALSSGSLKADSSLMVTLRFKVLTGELSKLFDRTKLASLAMVNTASVGVASAKNAITAI